MDLWNKCTRTREVLRGELANHHRVIAMDSRGQGKSELGATTLTYEQMAEDTNALLDHIKLRQVKVLGWSDGGIIGLLLTIHHPEKVSMLAMMGANLQPDAAYPWAVEGPIAPLRTSWVPLHDYSLRITRSA